MEMWRGFIVGLSKRDAPNDLDLLYDQIQCIKDDIEQYYIMCDGNLYDNRRPVSEAPSGDSGIDARSSRTRNSEGTSSTISGPGGGPIMRHKFTNNPKLDDNIPSWFFENCSRDKAEKILVNGNDLGNTLMRESSSQKAQGSYVISKLSKLRGQPPTVEHFEVERVDKGYRIKVENKHDPMSTLSEVMTFFMFTAGVETTVLMKSNCLADFGLSDDGDTDPYNMKKIERVIPDSSMELPEPTPDYEEPVPSKPRTFTPGILKKETHKFYTRSDTESNRKSSPGPLRQPPPPQSHPAVLRSPPPPPEPDQEFDDPAPGRESIYYNEKDEVWHLKKSPSQPGRPSSPPSASLPPPTPHLPTPQRYYNEKQSTDGVPRDQRAKSVPDIGISTRQLKIGPSIDLDRPGNKTKRFSYLDPNQEPPVSVKPGNSSLEQAIQQVKLRPTSNVGATKEENKTAVKSPKASATSPVTKSSSQMEDKVLTPQQMGLRPTPKREPEKALPSASVTQSDSAVDESHPGNVRSILGRFEQNAIKPVQPMSNAPNRKSGFIHSASTSKLANNTATGATNKSRHSFGGFSYLNNQMTNNATYITNASHTPTNGVWTNDGTCRYSNTGDIVDELYVNPDTIEPINTSDEDEQGDGLYHDGFSQKPASVPAVQSSFKRKLETQLSNPHLRIPKSNSNFSPVVSNDDGEEYYAELPEIPPEEDT